MSHPTSKNRSARQKLKERYAKAREDAQLYGLVETTPEGALKSERVDPKTQEQQDTTGIDRKAIARGWQVPEEQKGKVIDRLITKIDDEETSAAEVAMCANAVIKADQLQWERDNPVLAGKAKGSIEDRKSTRLNSSHRL